MVQLLRDGRPVFDPRSGEPVLKPDGTPLMKPASAADLAAIARRLRDTGENKETKHRQTMEEQMLANMHTAQRLRIGDDDEHDNNEEGPAPAA